MLRFITSLVFSLALVIFPISAPRALAQDAPKLTAVLTRNGEIIVRQSASKRLVVTIRPGLFEAPWQFRGTVPGPTPGTAIVRATTAGAKVDVTLKVTTEAAVTSRALKIEATLTASRDVKVNSAHVALLAPLTPWIAGIVETGATKTSVKETPAETRVADGQDRISLSKGSGALAIDAVAQPILLQDNRNFDRDELEFRVGLQSPAGRVLKAGASETITFTLTLPGPVSLIQEKPITLAASDDWVPLDAPTEILAGSALDFSFLSEHFAGKFGRVIVRPDGHFGFESGAEPARFYGVVLSGTACFPVTTEADKLAERLWRLGYNAVKLSDFDDAIAADGYPDRLDYLIFALKKRGVYVHLDLFSRRRVVDAISRGDFLAAVAVSEPALADWKAFVAARLNHVNPYTKLAWKDDPAIAWASVANDNNLVGRIGRIPAGLLPQYEAEWTAWRAARMLALTPFPTAPVPASRPLGRELGAFFAELQARTFAKMDAFIRKELGAKLLLTDLSGSSETPAYRASRVALDFVETRFSWDAPRFLDTPDTLPSEGSDSGDSPIFEGGAGVSRAAGKRLFGKPFVIGSFDYPAPNRYRAEAGLLVGAAASIQDWDAVFRNRFADSRDALARAQAMDFTSLVGDPLSQATDRIALLLFRREDMRVTNGAISLVSDREALLAKNNKPVPDDLGPLALVARVGARVDNGSLAPPRPTEFRRSSGTPADVFAAYLGAGRISAANKTDFGLNVRHAEHGESYLDGDAGVFRVLTARTIGGTAPEGEKVSVGPLAATLSGASATVFVTSLDAKPVVESARLLVGHLTDVQMTGTRFGSIDYRILESFGTLPHLARAGSATFVLTRKFGGKVSAWRLDLAGNRIAPVAVEQTESGLSLLLSTRGSDGKATLFYEIVVATAAKPSGK